MAFRGLLSKGTGGNSASPITGARVFNSFSLATGPVRDSRLPKSKAIALPMNTVGDITLLNRTELAATLGVSSFLLRKLIASDDFPRPVTLHQTGRLMWRLDEIHQWSELRLSRSRAERPVVADAARRRPRDRASTLCKNDSRPQ